MMYGCNLPTKVGYLGVFKVNEEYFLCEVSNIILDLDKDDLKIFYNTKENKVFKSGELLYSHFDGTKVKDVYTEILNNHDFIPEYSLESYGMFATFTLK